MKTVSAIAFVLGFALVASASKLEDLIPLHITPAVPSVLPQFQTKEGRIVGGVEVEPHSLPYQVGLILDVGGKSAWCGGSIISKEYILTAAHCAEPAKKATVILGAHNINQEEPGQLRIDVPEENLIVHEEWSMLTLTNDIALIKLPQPIEFNDQIQPINLPRKSQRNDLFVDENTVASGWGKDKDSATAVSPVLRSVQVPVIKERICKLMYFGVIKKSHICVSGKGGKSTCNGDSGGPLALTESDGSKTLLGATSFGIAFGCEKNWPAVFTRITHYLDWISNKTGIELRD